MSDIFAALERALGLIFALDADLLEIVVLSFKVSLTATACAILIGMPLGAALAISNFPGRRWLTIAVNAMMGLPPVVVGLMVYLLLSRSGPLGVFGLLFTPAAMIVAQTILVTPIVAALTRQHVHDLWIEYDEQLRSFGARGTVTIRTLLWDGRFSLLTVALAGFGRASAEVGAVMIVGGNIDHLTRVMTTAIALEISKGDLPLALGLGVILITLSLCVNAFAYLVNDIAARRYG